jgi:hypothetical protein
MISSEEEVSSQESYLTMWTFIRKMTQRSMQMILETQLVQAWIRQPLIMLERRRMKELRVKSLQRRKRLTSLRRISNIFKGSTKRASHRRLGNFKVSLY